MEKFPMPSVEDEGSEELETENRETYFESIREKLRDFKEREKTDEIETNHLIGGVPYPEVDIDELTEEDLEMFGRLQTFTSKELRNYRLSIPDGDENRQQFVAFLSNEASPRLTAEIAAKKRAG